MDSILASRGWSVIINRVDSQQEITMVALNEGLDEIAEEPTARSGCGAAEGAMTFPPKNQSNPRSVPYCSDSYFPGSDFSRHYARNRNYSPSPGRFITQDPLQFINGGNTYQFVMSNPVGNVDPWGLAVGHHIVPKQIYKLLFDPNSPGYGFFENFYTGKTSPNHGNSAAHQRYTDAVRKLVKKWLKGHPDVNPECPDFSEDNAKAIADDVLKSDDPGIRDFLQNVLNKVVDPSKYFQQMANTFEDAGGNLIATAKPESAPVENILQNIATNASNNAPRDETLAQQAESLLQEAENIIEADATALEQGIEEAP